MTLPPFAFPDPAVRFAADTICKHCLFWEELSDGEGECRRRSPRFIDNSEGVALRVWPRTYDEDWCGDGVQKSPPVPSVAD